MCMNRTITIHGCILGTGHDAISRSFTGWVYALLSWFDWIQIPSMRRVSWFRLRIGIVVATVQWMHVHAGKGKDWENRMTSKKPHGGYHGFGFGVHALPLWRPFWMIEHRRVAGWLMSLSPRWCCCGPVVHNDGRWLGVNCHSDSRWLSFSS